MPYDSNGNYSLPNGYLAVTGQTVLPSNHNPPLEDIRAALSQVLLRSGVAPMSGQLDMGLQRIVNLADAVNPGDGISLGQFQSSVVPVGSMVWRFAAAVPSGYLYCNGAAVSRLTYADLFNVIGTAFGIGDGSTTFNKPDLRGYFVRGWDDARGIDAGRAFGTTQADANKAHTHTGTTANNAADNRAIPTANSSPGLGTGGIARSSDASTQFVIATAAGGIHNHSFTTASDGAVEARPKNFALYPLIKF